MTTESSSPRRRDPARRRQDILEGAAQLVVENGAASLTHRAIAARAQVPLGSTTQYFSSIDEIREAALQLLADEIDKSLALMDPLVDDILTHPAPLVDELHGFLSDERALMADIALMTTATTDPRLRELALRWSDRLIDMLARPLGRERALAIATYYDGLTFHAGLHREPLDQATILRTLTALMTMPTQDSSATTEGP